MMLATSYDSILLKERGSTLWMMTWQASSARPYHHHVHRGPVPLHAVVQVAHKHAHVKALRHAPHRKD